LQASIKHIRHIFDIGSARQDHDRSRGTGAPMRIVSRLRVLAARTHGLAFTVCVRGAPLATKAPVVVKSWDHRSARNQRGIRLVRYRGIAATAEMFS
jgi:hypothetical protein